MMTPKELADIKVLLLAATPGAELDREGWHLVDERACCVVCGMWTYPGHPEAHKHQEGCEAADEQERRATALSALQEQAPTVFAALLAEIDRLTARVAEIEEAARWRVNADEPPPPTLSTVYGLWWPSMPSVLTVRDGEWSEGSYVVRPPTHWRPLGPGPEVSK